jgi:hypothetical protein
MVAIAIVGLLGWEAGQHRDQEISKVTIKQMAATLAAANFLTTSLARDSNKLIPHYS